MRAAAAEAADVAVAGTGGNDTFVFHATGPRSGSYTLNGVTSAVLTGVDSLSFIAGSGDDLCRIELPDRSVFAPPGGIDCRGGVGTDTVEARGGQADSGSAQSTTAGEGLLRELKGLDAMNLHFAGTEVTSDSVLTTGTFRSLGSDGPNTVTISDGPSAGVTRTEVDAGAPIDLSRKLTWVIDAQAGADTVTMASAHPGDDIDSLTVDTGGDQGDWLGVGDVRVVPDELAGVVTLRNSAGALVDLNGNDVNVVASGLRLEAGTGVGSVDDYLDVAAGHLSGVTTTDQEPQSRVRPGRRCAGNVRGRARGARLRKHQAVGRRDALPLVHGFPARGQGGRQLRRRVHRR